jgi:DnaJ homolog subfamily C member 7
MGEDEDGMSESSGMGGVHMTHTDLAELFAQFSGGGPRFGGGFSGGRHSHGPF